MSHRTWTDPEGGRWEVRPLSRGTWEFRPLPGNSGPSRTARAPSWQEDPFELSDAELRRVFEAARPPRRPPPSPFRD
ncbi:MAG: hypothetical protein RRA92_02300 [Gemmatimonadota bacterium]|nr:hypothetical protein [Gemmatimonadota bacterium]